MTNTPDLRLPSDTPLAFEGRALPYGAIGTRASGWWGMWFLILSNSMLFAYLFFAYFWYAIQPQANWIPGGPPGFFYPGLQCATALLGCVSAWFAERSIRGNVLPATLIGLGVTVILGAGFISLQFLSWFSKPFTFTTNTYSSIYFLITGVHLTHFVVGWLMFLVLFLWTALGYFDRGRHVPIMVGALYWYWLTAVWLAVFFVVDVTPYFS